MGSTDSFGNYPTPSFERRGRRCAINAPIKPANDETNHAFNAALAEKEEKEPNVQLDVIEDIVRPSTNHEEAKVAMKTQQKTKPCNPKVEITVIVTKEEKSQKTEDADDRPPTNISVGMERDHTELPSDYSNYGESELFDREAEQTKKERDIEKKARLGVRINRFHVVAKMMKNNVMWSKELNNREKQEESKKSFVVQAPEHGDEKTLTFNVNAFQASVQSFRGLTQRAKSLFKINSWNRSDDDANYLYKIIHRQKYFDKYPVIVQKELARVLYYETFESGRKVVQQGQPGLSFYFIVSGTVTLEVGEHDNVTGESHRQITGELGPGSSFGELALLHDSKRTATVICKGDCEFLRVDKQDFDMVLKISHQRAWEERRAIIDTLEPFENWSDVGKRAACDKSKLLDFANNSVITSNLKTSPENVYFVISGKCRIIREMTLLRTELSNKRHNLTLAPSDTEEIVRPKSLFPNIHQNQEKHFIHVSTFGQGRYFGVGEDLSNIHITAYGKVQCLLVNAVVFKKHGTHKCLADMRETAEMYLPGRQQVFESYMTEKRWTLYKKRLIQDLLDTKKNSYPMGNVCSCKIDLGDMGPGKGRGRRGSHPHGGPPGQIPGSPGRGKKKGHHKH
uniref:Cyclic nucleotide-binding domain-containing protein 2-like n=1 Tax=Saccoglossus kowalevskii TaxID=10224 RepID=A0ABM0MVB7_SACKO|nr:PREDICTED: cyclic nucleotide-binding domain-containing protein 2-like [Saccoglossus kowalevskii]